MYINLLQVLIFNFSVLNNSINYLGIEHFETF